VLVGHAGHPEVEGTMGPACHPAPSRDRVGRGCPQFQPRDPEKLAWATQTTLSVDDTAEIVAILHFPFPGDRRPSQGGHLLRDNEPAGGCEAGRPASRFMIVSARRTRPIRSACAKSPNAPDAERPF
jgi:4-hydroxy-3-methylbut-2-enyl diphosphate reductase